MGKGGPGRQRKILHLNFPCLVLIYEFLFHHPHTCFSKSVPPPPFKLGFLVPQIREQNIKFNIDFFLMVMLFYQHLNFTEYECMLASCFLFFSLYFDF